MATGDFSFSGLSSGSSSSWAGKTFTIGGGSSSTASKLAPAPDKIVKPGLSDDVLQQLALMRPPVVNGIADLRWGKPSKFDITEPNTSSQIAYITPSGGGVIVHLPQDDAPMDEYDEVQRTEDTVRVENPADPEQYVMVARCSRVVFQHREEGFFMALNFANPSRV